MTDIPGTDKLTVSKTKSETPTITPISIVNIQQLKKSKVAPKNPQLWYENIYFFLAVGVLIGLFFLALSSRYPKFFILVPLGPVVTISSWYIRKIFK